MRHQKKPKMLSFNRSKDSSSIKNQTLSLILYERIKTTKSKAKFVQRVIERLITIAKSDTLSSRRALLAYLPKKGAVEKMIVELGQRYKERPGGYTRIIKAGRRVGDGAEIANIELV